jgi:hypothetical protein
MYGRMGWRAICTRFHGVISSTGSVAVMVAI